jgi:hypothetical protein
MRQPPSSARLLPTGFRIEHMRSDRGGLTLLAEPEARSARCPICGSRSERVHSRYTRTASDLPWRGIAVRLVVRARRFFCDRAECGRRIFCERLGGIDARARKTVRLEEALLAIALKLGGEAGARLARELGLLASPDALLRRARRVPHGRTGRVKVLGVDDFALRRGNSYHDRNGLAKRSAARGRAPRGPDRRGTPPSPARGRPPPFSRAPELSLGACPIPDRRGWRSPTRRSPRGARSAVVGRPGVPRSLRPPATAPPARRPFP